MKRKSNDYRHNDDGTTAMVIDSPKYGMREVIVDTHIWKEKELSSYRWYLQKKGINRAEYAQTDFWNPDGEWRYRIRNGKEERYRHQSRLVLHRLIMETPKELETDHINGNGLDNRLENLRNVTSAENMRNVAPPSTGGASGLRGVSFDKRKKAKPWRTLFSLAGKTKHIGYFATKEEAAAARDRKAIELWGKPACPERTLNFPERLEEYLAEIYK